MGSKKPPRMPNEKFTCGRRKKSCRNPECAHRYTKAEYELWACPECGTDRHCEQPVDHEGDACRFHGGKSLKGVAAKGYKHGHYSKYVPKDLAPAFQQFLDDPEVVNLKQEAALTRTMLLQVLQESELGNTVDLWHALRDTYKKAIAAQARNDTKRFAKYYVELGKIIDDGVSAVESRAELNKQIEQTRRVVDTQRQINTDKGEFIQRAWVIGIMLELVDVIRNEIGRVSGGQGALQRIQEHMAKTLGKIR